MGVSIQDIVSYEDNKTDILINYALLGITLVPTVLVTASLRPSSLYILSVPITLLGGLFAFQVKSAPVYWRLHRMAEYSSAC